MDEVVHLPRPGLAERARLIRLYYSIYLHHDPPSDFLRGRAAPAATAVGAAGQGETAGHRESVVTISGHTHIAHVEGHKRSSTGCGSTKNDIDSSASTTESNTDDDNNNAVGKKSPEAGADTTPAVTSQQQPDLQGHRDAEKRPSVWSRIFDKKKRGGADSDGGLGVVKISEGFKRKAPRLMAMLAVRSEGFYGRDMAHLFSAVQVGRKTRTRTNNNLGDYGDRENAICLYTTYHVCAQNVGAMTEESNDFVMVFGRATME